MQEKRICSRCIMPESLPEIFLDENGVCNLCHAHDAMKKFEDTRKPLETDLLKILDKYRGKNKYDCMVMCSGGKDSTSALYFMKKRYKLNVLAFMFDHGFESEEAIENVKKATDKLGVDLLFFKSAYMKEMFRKLVETDSRAVICHPCSIWYMDLAFDVAARYEIPIIVAGWTKGQSQKQEVMSKCGCNVHTAEFKKMADNTVEFLNNSLQEMPQYKNFPKSMEEVLRKAKRKHKALVISPHWFLPYGPKEYVKLIKDELDWKAPLLSYPQGSTNCRMNFMSVYYSLKHYGYTHYHVEASKLIRENILTRDEAMEQLKLNFDSEELIKIARELGLNDKDFEDFN